jgi:hypothetical protein
MSPYNELQAYTAALTGQVTKAFVSNSIHNVSGNGKPITSIYGTLTTY